jgi:hypothetical protein
MKVTDLLREICDVDDRIYFDKDDFSYTIMIKIDDVSQHFVGMIPIPKEDDWIGLILYKHHVEEKINNVYEILKSNAENKKTYK